jgi:RNA polymerase sigma factor (sigma-70 family)
MNAQSLDTLVKKALEHDNHALRQLIELVQDDTFQFCLFLTKNKETAEDLCHDTLVKAIEKLKDLKSPEKFVSWVKQIAKRKFLDFQKSSHQAKTQAYGEDLEEVLDLNAADASDPSQSTALAIDVLAALKKMPHEDQMILILADIQAHSYEEISEIMNLKIGTVKSRINRVRRDFSFYFEQNETPARHLK